MAFLFDTTNPATTPADNEAVRLGAKRIRDLKTALQNIVGLLWSADASGNILWQSNAIPPSAMQNGSLPPPGSMLPYAGATEPTGYLLCDGRAVAQASYPDLFAALGGVNSPFGVSGTNFNLPDLRGRVPVGLNNMNGNASAVMPPAAAAGAVPALQSQSLGGTGGEISHKNLSTESGIPAHTHTYQKPNANNTAAGANNGYFNNTFATVATDPNTAADAAQAHNNVQPSLFLNYIIKT